MGWNDSQRHASTAFMFALNNVLFILYRVRQTRKQLLSSEKEMLVLVEL